MTEIEYRKLLMDLVRAGDYAEKDELLELLNICSLRFEKTNAFTRNLWNHSPLEINCRFERRIL
ncbi:MAG: hypothetical protein NC409_11295 [Clostridium sp.]|nr:hypothetical protein [Clostridium sp.]